jgi:hypothetical protein
LRIGILRRPDGAGGRALADAHRARREEANVLRQHAHLLVAVSLLALMGALAGGAALRQSVTFDEVAHIGAGVSALQKLDLRMNPEHPPLPKILAALPLVVRGTYADYSSIQWTISRQPVHAFLGEWVFGDWLLAKWNDPETTLAWARLPMLVLTLLLGWVIYVYGRQLGGSWGGLLSLSVYVSLPAFLAFGPLVHTDVAVTLFFLLTVWSFAGLYRDPSRRQVRVFAACLAGALLSKFTAGLLFAVFPVFALSARRWPLPGQPAERGAARLWRKTRWRAALRGVLWAALVVYAFYFVLSVRQPTVVLDLIPGGAWLDPLRRLLMPVWLYLLGILMVLGMGSRPCFILGHSYPHGVWFYFPVLFVLKSPVGFLGLLALALTVWLVAKRQRRDTPAELIPASEAPHWRALWVSLGVTVAACLASRVSISIRHFSVPLVLLILMLAPLPEQLRRLRSSLPRTARTLQALTALLAASCVFTAVRVYPFYFPYVSPLGFGRPAYTLFADSNVDWNQSLPEVAAFVRARGLTDLPLDAYGFADPTVTVPQARIWNCQTPQESDRGLWVVVSANMILDTHNCAWLLRYPHQALGGGAMYAVRLPATIPAAGSPGGPPLASQMRQFGGTPTDLDTLVLFRDLADHPDKMPEAIEGFKEEFERQRARSR